MRLPVRMPQFGESAAEATVVTWLVKPGAAVAAEQELAEVQTEKSLLTVAAPAAGVLVEQCVAEGSALAVGDVLAVIEAEGAAAVEARPLPAAPGAKSSPAIGAPRDPAKQVRRAALRAGFGEEGFLSPRVKQAMLDHGLRPADLAFVTPTGADGRVSAEDIERYTAGGEPMSQVRQAVAAAMSRSWNRPLATVAMPLRLDALLEHRRSVSGRPSATIYALRALALALKAGSPLACRLIGNRLIHANTIDLAVAVEIDDGVLTPVVRHVEALGLAELTQQVETVIAKARTGRVMDAGEAVGSVSNYGVFGLTWATPIPLPGQGVILGIGGIQNVPDWNPATKSWDRARVCEMTLTFDHRMADGGPAGRLLQAIVDLMQHPERM